MLNQFKIPPPELPGTGGDFRASPLTTSAAMLPIHIEVVGLSKVYEKDRGLLSATFRVDKGESIAIIGHNGAGKSTLLKMLAGWIVPDAGEVNIDGINLGIRSAITRKIGFVPEKPNLFDFFSVEYNLRLFARLFRVPYARVEQTLQEFSLLEFRRNRVDVLSKGLKQRVNIGRSLLADPAILLLDEPTSGLDFEMTRQIYHLLSTIHSSGKTILFTSHRPEEIRTLATRIIAIHHAGIVFDGSPAEYFQSSVHQNLYA